jgi:hypothetical protein
MKKILFMLIYVVIIGNIAFAQSGYLNFNWGMSPNEVNSVLDNNQKEGYKNEIGWPDPIQLMMFHFYGSELRNSFDGRLRSATQLRLLEGQPMGYRYIGYTNYYYNHFINGGLAFYFENNRLIAVQTIFSEANIIRELETRYGRGTEIVNYDAKVWLNNNRCILLMNNPTGRHQFLEFVTYFEVDALRRICQDSMEQNRRELREEQQKNSSRID